VFYDTAHIHSRAKKKLRFSPLIYIIRNFLEFGGSGVAYMAGWNVFREAARRLLLLSIFSPFFFILPAAESAEVIVVGDAQLAPVAHIISGIRETLDTPVKVYPPTNVKDRLKGITEREDAKVVVALGRDALDEALRLPPTIPVIYDLVITPPNITRSNTTGFYMATPVREYMSIVRKYLPSLKHVAVVGSPGLIRAVEGERDSQVALHRVKNSFQLVEKVQHLESVDAVLLLPDVSLLSEAALGEIYLFSFRRGIPILGISEKSVRAGSLFALVFDPVSVGKNIGEDATRAINGIDIGRIPPSPPGNFDLFVNKGTAEKMNIVLPAELIRRAKRVYP
jgi:putative ABC transport system substrate-binding protein